MGQLIRYPTPPLHPSFYESTGNNMQWTILFTFLELADSKIQKLFEFWNLISEKSIWLAEPHNYLDIACTKQYEKLINPWYIMLLPDMSHNTYLKHKT